MNTFTYNLYKSFLVFFLIGLQSFCFSQKKDDTLFVNYYFNNPYSYTENYIEKGIEIEIVNEYISWLSNKKKLNQPVAYKKYDDLNLFYSSIKTGSKNSIGLASITINQERVKEFDFSTPYLKSVAFCITNGNSPDVKIKNPNEIMRTLGNMSALTIEKTSLEKYTNELKKQYVPEMKIIFHPNESKILDEISKNVFYFGYVDAISFWFYLKNNPRKFLKMQKALNQSKEVLGLIMPKGSQHKLLFNEFFNGPTGFKNSPVYHEILEKYLGSYMAQNVAIN